MNYKYVLLVIIGIIIGYCICFYSNRQVTIKKVTVSDTMFLDRKLVDTINVEIVKTEEKIKYIKLKDEEKINEALNADDTTAIKQFYRLLSD